MEPSSQAKKTFKCRQCDNDFKSENGLKIHIGKAHKSSDPPIKKLRDAILPALKPLDISPIRETRIIHCNNCDGHMSPNHTCDLEDIPDPSPKPPKKTCKKCFFLASIFKVHSTSLQAMTLQHYDTTALRHYGTTALWHYGSTAVWQYGTMALWNYGTTALRHYGATSL